MARIAAGPGLAPGSDAKMVGDAVRLERAPAAVWNLGPV